MSGFQHPDSSEITVPTGWRRYVTAQRLRWFILLSITAHVLLGLSWGVPAYVKQKQLEAAQRRAEAQLQSQQALAQAALAEARARDLARTVHDVENQTHKAFEKIADGLSKPEKEKTWTAIQPAVQPVEHQLAVALGDRSTTDQDLRNMQANLDRRLVKAMDENLTLDAGREEIDAFLTGVEERVVPELVAHYRGLSTAKVAKPVRSSADSFVKALRNETAAAIHANDADRHELGEKLKHLGAELDGAAAAMGEAKSLSTHKALSNPNEALRYSDDAENHLSSGADAAEAMSGGLSKLADKFEVVQGGSDFADRLNETADTLSRIRESISDARKALKDSTLAAASRHLSAAALTQRKLESQWTSVGEAADAAADSAERIGLGAVGAMTDKPLDQHIDERFSGAFGEKASQRVTTVLLGALRKRLEAAHVKLDEAMIASAGTQVRDILDAKVGHAGGFGLSTTQALRDMAGESRREAQLAEKLSLSTEPVIQSSIEDLVSDASVDSRLAELVAKSEANLARDEVRDRTAMLAARANDGRDNALDTVSLVDLRASAMSRSNQSSAGAADGAQTEPTTGPSDSPPVIDDIKKEILASVQAEIQKLLAGKISDDQGKRVLDHVAKASDQDLNHLAQDLIDPNVSDADLESRRLDFSKDVLTAVGAGLDKTTADDVTRELLKQLDGKAGDELAGRFRDAVKEHIAGPLAHEWHGEAEAEHARAVEKLRHVRTTLESARAVTDKATQILDRVKKDANPAHGDSDASHALDAANGQLQEVHAAISGAKADLQDVQKDLPAGAGEASDRLAEVVKLADAAAESTSNAAGHAKDGDADALKKGVAEAHEKIGKLRAALTSEKAGLDHEAKAADGQFIKAALQADNDSATGTPGVKSRIESKFNGEFRKQTLPRLTDQIVKGVQQKLEKAGVNSEGADVEALKAAVSAKLNAKVTGDAHVGEAVVSDLEHRKTFEGAKAAKAEPTTQQVERANEIADKVTESGVSAVVGGGTGEHAAAAAVKTVAGPAEGVTEAKDEIARMQGQLRGARGGLLADAGDNVEAKDNGSSVQGMRRKWRGILAGLDGDGTGASGGNAANGKGGANGNGGGGSGAAGGRPGGGRGGYGYGWGFGGDGIRLDEQKRRELLAAMKDRVAQKGSAWDRKGAEGDASQSSAAELHLAAIIVPATRPAEPTADDKPFEPSFKSLKFAVVPYLNKPIPIGDNFDAWKDIPAIHLRPERAMIKGTNLKITEDLPVKVAWDNHGLYFMLDMLEANGTLAKSRMENFWQCDCMEVFLDTMNTKELQRGNGAGQQFWFWPFGSLDDASAPGGESLFDRHTGFHFVALKGSELPCAARTTPTGCQMQCRVPIERVRDADLAPGKILGFNIAVDTSGELHYYWSASKVVGTSYHPDTWGDVLLGGSDGRIEFPAKLASETGSSSEKAVTAFAVGEPLRIRVTDRDMNLNDKLKDKVSVTVRNARGEQEVAILEETGADTGVFEGSVRTALALGDRIDGCVSVYEGESVAVTYVDQARANGARNTNIVSRIVAGPAVMAGKY